MDSFVETLHLHGTSIEVLKNLTGRRACRILTPCLQIAGRHFTAPSLSIEKGQEAYVGISCEWFESPYTKTDYWRISISETRLPTGIDVRSDGALIAPCTINFFEAEPISSVEIHSSRWAWSDDDAEEHIEYDSALLFDSLDRRRFCIWCQLNGPGIATEVHFTEDRELISEILNRRQLRMRLD